MRTRYDLRALAKRKGVKAGATLPAIIPTQALENELAAILLKVPAFWAAVQKDILAAYESAAHVHDAALRDDDRLQSILSAIGEQAARLAVSLFSRVRDWAVRVEHWHRLRFTSSVLSAVGVDVFPYINQADAQALIDATVQRNSSLITGLDDEARKRIEQAVWTGVVNQTPRAEIAKQFTETIGIARRRAKGIAKDQTNKLSSTLDRVRQEQAGITQFKWRTADDERVRGNPDGLYPNARPSHWALEGRVLDWNGPEPSAGWPGTAIACRCKAQAFIEGFE